MLRTLAVAAALLLPATTAAPADAAEPAVGRDFLAEYDDTAKKLRALAEAIPGEKYAWRPSQGARSAGEVFQHIARGQFLLAARAGVDRPADLPADLERLTSKPEVLVWLERALAHGRRAGEAATAADLEREVDFFGEARSVRGVYLRMLVHMNEHMGQLIAYARSVGVTPPWSQ